MDSKTQKELEDERSLQLEQEMKELSDEADDLFWFKYLEEDKQKSINLKSNWYEILIITLFIILWILSIYLEWGFTTVIFRISAIFFLSWFSSKSDIPIRHKWNLIYYFHFYKTKRLYTILILLTIIFVFSYGRFHDGLEWLFFLVLIPIFWFVWLFLWRFATEIVKFIHSAIKWEVDWEKVLKQTLLLIIIWVLARIAIKYDIHWLMENWSQKLPFLKIFL